MEVLEADPAELHAAPAPEPPVPTVRVCRPTTPAVVLGSSQSEDLVDAGTAAELGYGVVRRRSGGGAVDVRPGDDVWIEVYVPTSHRLAHTDVGRAFWWLGEVCAGVVAATGVSARLHRGAWRPGPGGRLVCFAGLGPGEVSVGGRKVVGISQRRRRGWSRFSLTVLTAWDPGPLRRLLVPLQDDPATASALDTVATGIDVDRDRLTTALVEAVTSL